MKTRIATVFIMLGLFLTSTAFAGELPMATKKARKDVTKIIKKELSYPEFAIEEKVECCVVVSINILDDGSMDVECANCVCPKMKEHVVSTLEGLDTEELQSYAGQNVKVKINFDLLLI